MRTIPLAAAAVPAALCALAAVLHASGSTNPVLLRMDTQAGHGIGSAKTQTDAPAADIVALRWRAGLADWQPAAK